METIGYAYTELLGTPCPICGDALNADHGASMPTWSENHDNVVCFDCYTKEA